MTTGHVLWQYELRFWTDDASYYEDTLTPSALMVLPDPAGVMDRNATIAAIRSAPRWKNVVFQSQSVFTPHDYITMLVYDAHADRGTPESRYIARCSSTYVYDNGEWKMALHHQTCLEPRASKAARE